jgi:hypothetical protein
LSLLWEQLPEPIRREISQVLAQMIAQQILPSTPKEESHE